MLKKLVELGIILEMYSSRGSNHLILKDNTSSLVRKVKGTSTQGVSSSRTARDEHAKASSYQSMC
jgi:hypothetical protein